MLPKGSYLKVLDRSGGRMQVYYGGDGDERRPAEGWVEGADVAVAQAPRWVMARSGAALRSGVGPGAQLSAWLLGKTVLQVLEDRGPQLRVFSLGDGAAREAEEGWVAASDLAPAGAMLAAESRGVKMLGQPEVAALRAGDGLWLTVPYRSQLDGSPAASANCGPASVGMALQSQGVMASTEELRDLANKLQGTSGPDNGFSIEYLWGVVERYGLKGYDLYGGAGLRRWSLDGLRQHLSQGHPVIPQLRFRLIPGREQSDYYEDHYVVISGMHGDDFIYNDAVDTDGPGYARLMSEATLARAWGQSFFPFAAFAVGKP